MFGDPFFNFLMFWIVAWAIVSIVRAKHSKRGPGWQHDPKDADVPPMFEKMADKVLAERDQEVAALKERIIILERIVTENHKSSSLAEEIDSLKGNA